MLPRPAHTPEGTGRLTAAGLDAVQRLEIMAGDDEPVLLFYYKPVPGNPFQALLYAACWEQGIAPVPVPDLGSLDELRELLQLTDHVVLHLHWTGPLTAGARDEDEARRRTQDLLQRLEHHRDAGGRIVWTVHNARPHDCPHPDVDLSLRRELVRLADVVHVLSEATMSATRRVGYELPPERIVSIPHPNYVTAYPRFSDHQAARADAGLHPTAHVIGAIGAIRPYKRIPALLDAFEPLLHDRGPSRPQLLVAGDGADHALRDRVDRHPGAIGIFEPLEPTRLVDLVRACDVIALPYRDVLNSGALMLALSCGRPAVAPAVGTLTDFADEPSVTLFDPCDPGDLTLALRDALASARSEGIRASALTVAERFDPEVVARRFAEAIRKLVTDVDQRAPTDS